MFESPSPIARVVGVLERAGVIDTTAVFWSIGLLVGAIADCILLFISCLASIYCQTMNDQEWDRRTRLLKQFHDREGHLTVPFMHDEWDSENGAVVPLGEWIKVRERERESIQQWRETLPRDMGRKGFWSLNDQTI